MKKNKNLELFKKPSIHIILIIAVGLLAYSNTFHVPFHFDDHSNIVENYTLRDLSNFWPPTGTRWFGFLTFVLNYHFGGLNTIGYHVVSLIIHIFNAILVYWLVALTLMIHDTRYKMQDRGKILQDTASGTHSTFNLLNYLPLFSALLFVSHPIQTQTVTYIVQRFTSLATFFYLLSLVMYIKARLLRQGVGVRGQGVGTAKNYTLLPTRYSLLPTRYPLYAVSLVSAILAMKTKEISFTLPIIIALYEFMFFEGKIKRRISYLIPILLTMLIIPLSMIGTDKPIGDAIGELREAAQETDEIPRWSYLFTQFRVIVTYIRLLVLPINQNLDYDYPIFHSFLNPEVFLSFLFLLLIFGLGVYLLYSTRYTLHATRYPMHPTRYSLPAIRLISFGIFWFFITLSVESSIIPIRDIIFEHRLYMPVIGIIIVFVSATFYILQSMIQNPKRSLAICYLLLATAVIVLSIAAYERNTVWRDGVSLWEDVVRKSPEKARGHYNLGLAYYNKGLPDMAIEHYQIALRLNPNYVEAHNNLGNDYYNKGMTDKAIEHYQIALRLKPNSAEAHYNLGLAYKDKGLTDMAIKHYQIALRLKPNSAEAHYTLGLAYKDKGLTDMAIKHYQIALRLKPDSAEAHMNMANDYDDKGMTDKAIEHYQIALRLKPNSAEAHYNLGLAYKDKGLTDMAIEHYQIALKLNPDYAEAHMNMANDYDDKGMTDKAIEHYQIALRLKPNSAEAHYNLGVAYGRRGLLDKAIKEYQIALRLNPEDKITRDNLNRILQIQRSK